MRLKHETKKMIRQSKKELKIYIANKTKSNPKEFYIIIHHK